MLAAFVVSGIIPTASARSAGKPSITIVCSPKAGFGERLAGREVRRYVYLRTGELLPLAPTAALPATGDAIVVGVDSSLLSQQYRLQTRIEGRRRVLRIAGGSGVACLYGTYRFAEKLGVRFYLHGDVVPDERIALKLPELDETGKPLFELRGLNPWGSHPFGFDLWNTDDYKMHISQMAKMRMNFIGMHCYPEGHPYAEPTVWVGADKDFDKRGRVKFSYPSVYYNALFSTRWGRLRPAPTSQYHLGAAALFDRDDWGADVLRGHAPRPTEPEACNEVFNRTGAMFNEAFGFARRMGVKTCLGTESPLTMPKIVKERLKAQCKNPADPSVVQGVYEGMFKRIAACHPLDYYWLWTPEGWTWSGNTGEQMKATIDDVKIALAAMKKVDAPFELATCGWVLGPAADRSGFDKILPRQVAMSAISRRLGEEPIDPAFGRIDGRGKWAIPWMEGDNGGLAVPQLWVGRTRQDAIDARRYGCTGLMGLIWRTRILGPNISQLAQAGWEQPWAVPATAQSEAGPVGGKPANYAGAAIAGTENDVVYQTCRFDTRGYDLEIPNGRYQVTLQFCEPHFNAAGKRVWDVTLQGRKVIKRLDIFAKAGKFTALDYSFDNVKVTDGRLKIGFTYVVSLPCISGIVIEGADLARKINCGGPAVKGYVADLSQGQTSTSGGRMRKVPCGDFYADWARTLFGARAAGDIAAIFAAIDSRLPRPLSRGCPAGVRPNGQPWEQVAPVYDFVAELAKCRRKVTGAGSRERFDYWLATMRYLRAGAKLDCAVGRFLTVMKKVNAEKELASRKRLAKELGVPAYREILAAYREAFGHLLATVSTKGGLATVMYWEHGFYPQAVGEPGLILATALEAPLPAELILSQQYDGPARLIVPTVRNVLVRGERFRLNVLVLAAKGPRKVTLRWRRLGDDGPFAEVPFEHIARGVYRVELPKKATAEDFEYHVGASPASGQAMHFPATAPVMNQTVICVPDKTVKMSASRE